MPSFAYRAVDSTGKVVAGEIEAADRHAALQRLRGEQVYPVQIDEAGRLAGRSEGLGRVRLTSRRVRGRDVQLFTEQLATLLHAGLDLDRSLEILGQLATNAKLRETVQGVRGEVQGGSSFADALGRYPDTFSRFYVSMVHAGEAGGALEVMLSRLATFLSRSQELREFLISALVYPSFLVMAAGGAVAILLLWVIPRFSTIFDQTGQALPLPMQLLLGLSGFLTRYWWLLLGLAFGAGMAVRQTLRSPEGRFRTHQWLLRLPVLGSILLRAEVARFCQTLGTLMSSGVPLLQALTIGKGTVGNAVIARAADPIAEGVRKGAGLSGPLAQCGLFPPLAVHMIAVGEETGKLEEMLGRVAEVYGAEVRQAIHRAMALAEPVMIVVMGLVVGLIVFSMLSAVFSINELPM